MATSQVFVSLLYRIALASQGFLERCVAVGDPALFGRWIEHPNDPDFRRVAGAQLLLLGDQRLGFQLGPFPCA
jgi:hypothetical protein